MPLQFPIISDSCAYGPHLATFRKPCAVLTPLQVNNSEKRKEKSRDAARYRRSKESDIFADLTKSLPLCSSSTSQLDKASVMRLTIAYLKSRALLATSCNGGLADENQAPNDFAFPNALEGFLLALSSEGDVVYVTENVNQHLGFPQIDIMGQSIYDYSHPCDHEELREMLSVRTDAGDDSRTFFLRLKSTLTTKGRSVNMKSASYKVINCSGRIVRLPGVDGSGRDAAPFYAVLICEPIPHPSNIEVPLDGYTFLTKHTMDMKYTYVDDKIGEFLGFSVGEMEGKSAYEFHHILDHDAVIKSYKTLLAKGQCQTPVYRFLARHGGFIWVQTQATLVYGSRDSRPQAVVCVHHVLSGIENEDQIFSISQEGARAVRSSAKIGAASSLPAVGQPITSRHPTAMTSKLIVPKTSDMDANTYLSFDALSGTAVFKEEPEDLTHLAPAAGDTCIPLEISTSFLSINELLEEEEFPPDMLECFPMTTFDFMNLNPEISEDIEGLHAPISPDEDPNDAISKTASIFKQESHLFSMANEEWEAISSSPPSLEAADRCSINLCSPIYSDESPDGPSEQRVSTPVSPMVSISKKSAVVLSNTTFRVTELPASAILEEEEEDYETRAPFIPNEDGHDLPIFDCADLFSEDLDCFLPIVPRPFASVGSMNFRATEPSSPVSSSLATLLQENSVRVKTLPTNIGSCPFLERSEPTIALARRDQGIKRQTQSSATDTPDEKRFKGISSTTMTVQSSDSRKGYTAQLQNNRLLDLEDSMLNPVQIPLHVRGAQIATPVKSQNFYVCPPDRPHQQKPKLLEPETLRKLLTQPDMKLVTNGHNSSGSNSSSVLQNLLVSGHDERTGYKVAVNPGIRVQDRTRTSSASATSLALPSPLLSSTSRKVSGSGPTEGKPMRINHLQQNQLSRDNDSDMFSIHSVEHANDLDTSVDSSNLPILLSPGPDFFDQLPMCFGTVD